MPARNERFCVSSLRPCTPAENEPAEPNALMQSVQLICSLTPSSTEPSTWLVIIWLKRCSARPLIDPPLESAPVGVGVGVGDALAVGEGVGVDVGVEVGDGDGLGEGQTSSMHAAAAGRVCAGSSSADIAAVSTTIMIRLLARPIMVSARTGC